jgi:hypothetical protein
MNDNIRMDVRDARWEIVDLIHLAEESDQWQAVVNTVMHLRVPYETGIFLNRRMVFNFSTTTVLHTLGYLFSYRNLPLRISVSHINHMLMII